MKKCRIRCQESRITLSSFAGVTLIQGYSASTAMEISLINGALGERIFVTVGHEWQKLAAS